jgi:SecD/SecF fusion protein
MKTIIYSIITILLFGSIAMGFDNKANTKGTFIIQCTDKNVSSALLSQSANTISARLKDFNRGKSDVLIIPEKNQIKVTVPDSLDLSVVEKLLTQKGTIGFYETFNHEKLVGLLNGNNQLFSMVKSTGGNYSGAKIGCTTVSEVQKVNDYLNTLGLNQKCKFAWTRNYNSNEVCLFALKLTNEKGAIISGTDIDNARFNNDRIQIKLKKPAVGIWSEATKRNMDNEIAIVLDNNVISYPRVRSVIDSGEIEISGSFTSAEGSYMAAVLNNGELPLNFSVIK